jgi:hypothetical protein
MLEMKSYEEKNRYKIRVKNKKVKGNKNQIKKEKDNKSLSQTSKKRAGKKLDKMQ